MQSATVSWEFPLLGDRFGLQAFTVSWKKSTSSDWKALSTVDHHRRHFDIPFAEFPALFGGPVDVVVRADYNGQSVPSEVHSLCMTTTGNYIPGVTV